MDRWQNTLEEMISLKSSSAPVFKDNYWAQNGFDELRRYVKQGSDFSKELASILQERLDAELYYSKCLSKLATKLGKACKESVGSCMEAWKHVAHEMEEKADIHRNFSNSLAEDLVKPMKNVIEGHLKLRKKIEGSVDKTTRALAEWRTAEAKAKKQSHAACRENEKLQDVGVENGRVTRSASMTHIPRMRSVVETVSSEKDACKLQTKRRKTEEAVKKAEAEYYTVCVQAERARLEWESAVVKGAGMMEALEEERLTQMKKAADVYLKLSTSVPPLLAQSTKNLSAPIEKASPTTDMAVIRNVRSMPPGACLQLLPDFYCEHTALAMNKERRKQSILKILQLIKQDIDRERKSKQGLEKLSMAIKQTPTFGSDDSQQNVADKLYHMRAMLTYLEASRYKLTSALNELEQKPTAQHPLAAHIEVHKDKQGLQQTLLKIPPWLQSDYQMEVNKNLQPSYQALAKSLSRNGKPEESDRRDSIISKTKFKIDHITFRSAPSTPVPQSPAISTPSTNSAQSRSRSPTNWSERGAADGLSTQHDSDFDEFSSDNGSACDLTQDPNLCQSQQCEDSTDCNYQPIGKCRVLYDYVPKLTDELTLSPGDIIEILEKQDDGWWSGELNGTIGIFPATYVEEITTAL